MRKCAFKNSLMEFMVLKPTDESIKNAMDIVLYSMFGTRNDGKDYNYEEIRERGGIGIPDYYSKIFIPFGYYIVSLGDSFSFFSEEEFKDKFIKVE